MNILIIGANGFIGSHCAHYFVSKGYKVCGADIQANTALKLSNYYALQPSNTVFEHLFTNQHFDLCINASGAAVVNFSFENPKLDFELNVNNVQKILLALRDYQPYCRFINFSSAAVYGNPTNLPIKETTPALPVSPYGLHKLQSEELLSAYHRFFGLKTVSLRIFSVYGVGLKKQLFWDIYQKYKSDPLIELFGTGRESRDFIHIEDLTKAIDLVSQHAQFEGEIINVANGQQVFIEQAVTILLSKLGASKKVYFSGSKKQGDPLNWQADISLLRTMGYVSSVSLEQGLTQYALWLKELK